MAKTRQQKEEILKKLEGAFKAPSSVFVRFTKITVKDESAMRNKFRAEGIKYFVAKKTLIQKALAESAVAGKEVTPVMDGEVALIYGLEGLKDPSAPARTAYDFVKEFTADRFTIVGGVFEGKLMDGPKMNEIATIPPMQVLRGMFVNILNSPIQRMAVALGQIAEKKA
jgi:large subunit ribosomal protein L10